MSPPSSPPFPLARPARSRAGVRTGSRRGRGRQWAVLVVGALGIIAALTSCSSSESTFDRSAAIERVIRDSGGRLTRTQAECYVDRVVGEVGSGALTTGSEPAPEYLPKLTRIRVDCTGVASMGTDLPTSVTTADGSLGSRPQKPGDDPELDALVESCRATGAQACDDLFDKAAPGSQYEELASTCGGRTKELSCAATYGASDASSSTTSTTSTGITTSTTSPRAPAAPTTPPRNR